jgi:hypothetical protein
MRTTSWLVIGISALLVLATSFAAARSVLANTQDPVVIDVEAAPGGVVIEVPAPTGEVFVADALSMELLEVQIDGVSPFGPSESTVSIDVAAVRYFPSRKVVSLEIRTAADATTNCTLQAVFNPTTQRWSYRCNASAVCPSGKKCTLLRDGAPVVVGQTPTEPSQEVVYECDCR